MKKLYNIFCFPALLIHEFSHVIAALLTFHKVTKVKITFNPNTGRVITKDDLSRSFLSEIIIGLSPLFTLITFFVLSFFSTISLVIFIYMILSLETSLPSSIDIDNIKMYNYKKRNIGKVPSSDEWTSN